MKKLLFGLFALLVLAKSFAGSKESFGKLIFEDSFERTESQELKDEPGNEWTTSSEKTAAGNKQVDLVNGVMHMWKHKDANHATSTRHAFEFTDGTIGMRFKLDSEKDHLRLNFTDMELKTVHAGHLFDADIGINDVSIEDKKTGSMDLVIRNARKANAITDKQLEMLKTKKRKFDHRLEKGVWHDLLVHVDADTLVVIIDGKEAGRFRSEGIAHSRKALLRLLVPGHAYIDDIKIWRRR
jgi:hypothetical protein